MQMGIIITTSQNFCENEINYVKYLNSFLSFGQSKNEEMVAILFIYLPLYLQGQQFVN